MTVVINNPKKNHKIGKDNLPQKQINKKYKRITLTLSRDNWPDTGTDVVSAQIDLSLDDGATWISPFIGFTARGGAIIDREGNVKTESKIDFPLPEQVGNTKRLIRGLMDIKKELDSAISVDVT